MFGNIILLESVKIKHDLNQPLPYLMWGRTFKNITISFFGGPLMIDQKK